MSATAVAPEKGFELRITRTFDAPRELVWKAWTDSEMQKQWMGPRGFLTTEIDLPKAPGASWRRTMEGHIPHSGDPVKLRQHGKIVAVKPPELLVFTFAWDVPADVGLSNMDFAENTVTVRLEERGSKTVMTFTQGPFLSEGACDGHTGGWNSSFDRFAEFMLAEQPGRVSDPDEIPTELHLKRFFAAPRRLVFDAWTQPEMLEKWWGPRGFTTTVRQLDTRGGGEILFVMKGPNGMEHPMSGRFLEFIPPFRLHFTASALDANGNAMFTNWNSVFFEEVEGGTRVSVDVHVMSASDVAPQYLKGMSAGWSQSLDRLGEFIKVSSPQTQANGDVS